MRLEFRGKGRLRAFRKALNEALADTAAVKHGGTVWSGVVDGHGWRAVRVEPFVADGEVAKSGLVDVKEALKTCTTKSPTLEVSGTALFPRLPTDAILGRVETSVADLHAALVACGRFVGRDPTRKKFAGVEFLIREGALELRTTDGHGQCVARVDGVSGGTDAGPLTFDPLLLKAWRGDLQGARRTVVSLRESSAVLEARSGVEVYARAVVSLPEVKEPVSACAVMTHVDAGMLRAALEGVDGDVSLLVRGASVLVLTGDGRRVLLSTIKRKEQDDA